MTRGPHVNLAQFWAAISIKIILNSTAVKSNCLLLMGCGGIWEFNKL